jgi:hypothetical protein
MTDSWNIISVARVRNIIVESSRNIHVNVFLVGKMRCHFLDEFSDVVDSKNSKRYDDE